MAVIMLRSISHPEHLEQWKEVPVGNLNEKENNEFYNCVYEADILMERLQMHKFDKVLIVKGSVRKRERMPCACECIATVEVLGVDFTCAHNSSS